MMKRKVFQHRRAEIPEINSITDERGKRVYITPSGQRYTSVTTFLSMYSDKEGLEKWRQRVGEEAANEIMERSSSRGNAIHSLCEAYICNEDLVWTDENKKYKGKFGRMGWALNYIDDIRCVESGLWSDEMLLAGRVDLIASYKGIPSVIDFKTSGKEKSEKYILHYFLQATAYSLMFEELTGEKIEQIVIMILCDDGTVQTFIKERSTYVPILLNYVKHYKNKLQLLEENPENVLQ